MDGCRFVLFFCNISMFRELRVSDIGDIKRAVLLSKTQRSLSVTKPYLESSRNDYSNNQELHLNPSDLNNNASDESKATKVSFYFQ